MNYLGLRKINIIYLIDIIVFIFSILSGYIFFKYSIIDTAIKIQGYLFLAPIILSTIFLTLFTVSSNQFKKICFFSLMFSLMSISSFIIIDNFLKYHFNTTDKRQFFSLFNFVRSIFYYYIIRSIFTFFTYSRVSKVYKLVEILFFIFMLLNTFIFVFLNYYKSNTLINTVFNLNHCLCYIFKDAPFFIAIYLSLLKLIQKKDVYNLLILIASLINIFSVIFQLYYVENKQLISHMEYMMVFQIILFSFPIFIHVIKTILSDKKIYEIDKNETISQIVNELHIVKNKLDINHGKNVNDCIKDVSSTMKWLEDLQIILDKKLNIKHFFDIIIDQYKYSDQCEINNIDIIYKHKFLFEETKIDEKKLSIVTHNLISNAIQHSKKNEKNEIYIEARNYEKYKYFFKKKYLYFRIVNNGEISFKHKDQIYLKGFSTKNTPNINSGNGLHDCYKIIKYLNGKITHNCYENKVEFKFEIPLSN